MSKSSYSVQIPSDPRRRLRVLFRLSHIPKTLGELADLNAEYIKKCLKEPRLKAHFEAILNGEKVFGTVDYKTLHTVRLPSQRQVYVACALDALIEGFFLPIEIDSTCFHCGQRIRIRMSQGTIDLARPSSTIIWLGASKEGDDSCAASLCPYTNFFCFPRHVAEWKEENPNELGMMLTLQQSLDLARKGHWEPIRLVKTEV